jgi:transcriptional regulator with XRE-family HTH domain
VARRKPVPQFAVNLRECREAAGLSQVALHERSGVDLKHINGIEKGSSDATIAVLVDLARGLRTTPSELLRGVR